MVGVGREVEMVDGNVTALSNVFESYGASYSRRASCYGGGFGEEEVVRHGERQVWLGGWIEGWENRWLCWENSM